MIGGATPQPKGCGIGIAGSCRTLQGAVRHDIMSILIDADTRIIVQGITGREAVSFTRDICQTCAARCRAASGA